MLSVCLIPVYKYIFIDIYNDIIYIYIYTFCYLHTHIHTYRQRVLHRMIHSLGLLQFFGGPKLPPKNMGWSSQVPRDNSPLDMKWFTLLLKVVYVAVVKGVCFKCVHEVCSSVQFLFPDASFQCTTLQTIIDYRSPLQNPLFTKTWDSTFCWYCLWTTLDMIQDFSHTNPSQNMA